MTIVEVLAKAPGTMARDIFPRLCDFGSYARYSDQVRSVQTKRIDVNRAVSQWEVIFQNGILRWTEEDTFDPERLTIDFRQTEGDVESFAGQWSIRDTEGGCFIRFYGELDLGIATLADILDPIAADALQENIQSILQGLLSGCVDIISVDTQLNIKSSYATSVAPRA